MEIGDTIELDIDDVLEQMVVGRETVTAKLVRIERVQEFDLNTGESSGPMMEMRVFELLGIEVTA